MLWMWSKFPKLKHLETTNLPYINPILFEKFLFRDKNSSNHILNQIKTFSNLPNKEKFKQIKSVTIDKTNLRFGVWVGDRMVAWNASHAYILWSLTQCKLVDSPFNKNQKYLLIKIAQLKFFFEDLTVNENWDEKEQEFYSEIYKEYYNENSQTGSILFIIPVPDISIPENLRDAEMKLNITVNDFRPIYNLCWSHLEANKELEKYIDTINDNSLLEISLVESIKLIYMQRLSTKLKTITKDL